MNVALNESTNSLAILAGRLRSDGIKTKINDIHQCACKCVSDYNIALRYEGNAVLAQKEALANTASVREIDVQKMKTSLGALTTKMNEIKNEIVQTQAKVNQEIEPVRQEKLNYKNEKYAKNVELDQTTKALNDIPPKIKKLEGECKDFERAADELENRVRELREQEEKHKGWAFLSLGVGLASIVLIPFTGGLSLALTALGTAGVGINLYCIDDCQKNATKFRRNAEKNRDKIRSHESDKRDLEHKQSILQREVQTLNDKIERIESEMATLQVVADKLREIFCVIDNGCAAFKTMDNAFHEAMLSTNSFSIIQKTFTSSEGKDSLNEEARMRMERLKACWEVVERVIRTEGRDSTQYRLTN